MPPKAEPSSEPPRRSSRVASNKPSTDEVGMNEVGGKETAGWVRPRRTPAHPREARAPSALFSFSPPPFSSHQAAAWPSKPADDDLFLSEGDVFITPGGRAFCVDQWEKHHHDSLGKSIGLIKQLDDGGRLKVVEYPFPDKNHQLSGKPDDLNEVRGLCGAKGLGVELGSGGIFSNNVPLLSPLPPAQGCHRPAQGGEAAGAGVLNLRDGKGRPGG